MSDSTRRPPRLKAHLIVPLPALGLGLAAEAGTTPPPVPADDHYSLVARTRANPATPTSLGNVLANDTGTGAKRVVTPVAQHYPAGDLSIDVNGVALFRVTAPCAAAPISASYVMTDQSNVPVSANVFIDFTSPIAPDSYTVNSGALLTGRLRDNDPYDTDPGYNGIAFVQTTDPAHGSGTLAYDSGFSYQSNPGYTGHDSYAYTVSGPSVCGPNGIVDVTVLPVLQNDGAYYPARVNPTTGNVLANDTGSNAMVVATHTQPAHGTLTIAPSGDFTYTPDAGYHGYDAFTYNVDDGGLAANVDATVSFYTILHPPTPQDDHLVTAVGQAVTANVLANDTDPDSDPLIATGVYPPLYGNATLANDGTLVYTPNAHTSGIDQFGYGVNDGYNSVVAVVFVEIPPTATNDSASGAYGATLSGNVLANDDGTGLTVVAHTSPAHGTLNLAADGSFTYAPNAGYSGSDGFQYTVQESNSALNAVASVSFSVGNAAPVAVNDSATLSAGQTATGNVLTNDTDANLDPLSVLSNTAASHGAAMVASDGSFTYTPATGYSGTDSFGYTITDGHGGNASAVVNVLVNPVAQPDAYSLLAGLTLSGNVLTNDLGSGLTATTATPPAHGTLNLTANGAFTYTPDSGFSGTDGFDYTITDANGSSVAAHVTLGVGAVATPVPAAQPVALGVLGTLLAWIGWRRRRRDA